MFIMNVCPPPAIPFYSLIQSRNIRNIGLIATNIRIINGVLFHFIAIFYLLSGVYYDISIVDWRNIIITGYIFGCFASIAHHRYFTHNSFKTSRMFQFILDLIGTFGFASSGLQMCSWHITHHQYEDKIGDPHYNPNTNLIYRYIGHYLHRQEFKTIQFENVIQYKAYPELFLLILIQPYLSYVLYSITICYYYNIPFLSILWGCYFTIPIVASWHFQLIDGYPGHIEKFQQGHKTTFSQARNCWWIAILNCGGGWHGSHHQFKNCAWHGHKWYHIDIVFLMIKILETVGLVWGVHTVKNKNDIIKKYTL